MYVSLFPRTVQVGHLEDYRKEGVGGGEGRGGRGNACRTLPKGHISKTVGAIHELLLSTIIPFWSMC